MSNAELIERLRKTPNWVRESYENWKGCVSVYDRAPFEAADALELADKRIAEQAEEIAMLRAKHLYTCGTTHPEMYKTELDHAKERIAVYAAERDHVRNCYERTIKILSDIHVLLYPPATKNAEGVTLVFHSPMVHEQMQALSDRIRAIPDEVAQINYSDFPTEAERKLAVAREALKNGRTYLVRMALINAGMLLASGEFTTLVNDSLDEFINDHLHEVSDSESPISEFDWTRITIRKMGEALAHIGGEDAGT